MGIPGLKIGTAASPAAAYGITKSMIRDNGPTFLFAPVKMMKESKGSVDLDKVRGEMREGERTSCRSRHRF